MIEQTLGDMVRKMRCTILCSRSSGTLPAATAWRSAGPKKSMLSEPLADSWSRPLLAAASVECTAPQSDSTKPL